MVDSPSHLQSKQSWQFACSWLQGKREYHTPLELAINNQVDRFSIAIDVIDRVTSLSVSGAHANQSSETCRLIVEIMLMPMV